MPPRFMSVAEAALQLLQIIEKREDTGNLNFTKNFSRVAQLFYFLGVSPSTLCIGLARVGSDTQQIVACSLTEMGSTDLGGPLHSLIIPAAELHPLEAEYVTKFKV